MGSVPYIVLLGDVGAGKSTIIERLTGETGRSSAKSKSVTLTSEVFEVYDGSLIICDTPGSNAMGDEFKHNLHIAHAMNFKPVTSVLIVVKADVRMDNVIKTVSDYAVGFIPGELPIELIGVCITHMDTVTWNESDLSPHLMTQLGIESAVFCDVDTPQETLRGDLLFECAKRKPIELSIDGEMFLTLFQINSTNLKVLHDSRKEVSRFEKMKYDYCHQRRAYSPDDQMNMAFEFQAYMLDEIRQAERRLSAGNKFTFTEGPESASEAGHIENMTNQLRNAIGSVSAEAACYHKRIIASTRKCPYCPAVWQEFSTPRTCGSVTTDTSDNLEEGLGQMSTFTFTWDFVNAKLIIEKVSKSEITADAENSNPEDLGCRNTIEWSLMAPFKDHCSIINADYAMVLEVVHSIISDSITRTKRDDKRTQKNSIGSQSSILGKDKEGFFSNGGQSSASESGNRDHSVHVVEQIRSYSSKTNPGRRSPLAEITSSLDNQANISGNPTNWNQEYDKGMNKLKPLEIKKSTATTKSDGGISGKTIEPRKSQAKPDISSNAHQSSLSPHVSRVSVESEWGQSIDMITKKSASAKEGEHMSKKQGNKNEKCSRFLCIIL